MTLFVVKQVKGRGLCPKYKLSFGNNGSVRANFCALITQQLPEWVFYNVVSGITSVLTTVQLTNFTPAWARHIHLFSEVHSFARLPLFLTSHLSEKSTNVRSGHEAEVIDDRWSLCSLQIKSVVKQLLLVFIKCHVH